jgi:sulfate transport system ATP-binding protein
MRSWLRDLQRKLNLTSILVTHDQDEALELADRVAVMEQGQVLQYDVPQQVYDRPATPAVYDFLGGANRLAVRVSQGRVLLGDEVVAVLAAADDAAAQLHVRSHDIQLLPADAAAGLQAQVLRATWGGASTHYDLRLAEGSTVEVDQPRWAQSGQLLAAGDTVRLRLERFGVFGPVAGSHHGITG